MRTIVLLLGLSAYSCLAQIKTVTTAFSLPSSGSTNYFFSITSNEVAKVACRLPNDGTLDCSKDNRTFSIQQGAVIAGPARFSLYVPNAGVYALTFQVFFQVENLFPPDKTLIIPEDSTGAFITMESSTNLVDWITVTNGFYTGTNGAKFFRIRGDRIL